MSRRKGPILYNGIPKEQVERFYKTVLSDLYHEDLNSPLNKRVRKQEQEFEKRPLTPQEEALQLLHRAEQRSKRKLKYKLDKKIDEDIELMRAEAYHRKLERIARLMEVERRQEYETQQKLELIQVSAKDMMEKKIQLVKKLAEIELIDKMSEIFKQTCQTEDAETRFITQEEVQRQVREQQRRLVDKIVPEARERFKNTFYAEFEEMTAKSIQQEEAEIRAAIEKHTKPLIHERDMIIQRAEIESMQLLERIRKQIVNERIEEIKRKVNEDLKKAHQRKVILLKQAHEMVGLQPDEIDELLQEAPKEFDCKIGLDDAEIERLKDEITAIRQQIAAEQEAFKKESEERKRGNIDLKKLHDEELTKLIEAKEEEEALNQKEKELQEPPKELEGRTIAEIEELTKKYQDDKLRIQAEIEKVEREFQEARDKNAELRPLERRHEKEATSCRNVEKEAEELKKKLQTILDGFQAQIMPLENKKIELMTEKTKADKEYKNALKNYVIEMNQKFSDILTKEARIGLVERQLALYKHELYENDFYRKAELQNRRKVLRQDLDDALRDELKLIEMLAYLRARLVGEALSDVKLADVVNETKMNIKFWRDEEEVSAAEILKNTEKLDELVAENDANMRLIGHYLYERDSIARVIGVDFEQYTNEQIKERIKELRPLVEQQHFRIQRYQALLDNMMKAMKQKKIRIPKTFAPYIVVDTEAKKRRRRKSFELKGFLRTLAEEKTARQERLNQWVEKLKELGKVI